MSKRVHLVCNAHLDPVWLWQWCEGAAEAISTFRTAAELCEKDKAFIFNHNEVVLYEWVREYEPALFKRIQKLVRAGQWHIMGGWYLQPDCNMPSGESLVRQILAGREYFRKYFGAKATTAINVDPFGHSRGLVQILAKSGFDSYLFGRPGTNVMPDLPNEFVWVGFDGSEVLATRFYETYWTHLGRATEEIQRRLKAMPKKAVYVMPWGVGNHGGGPSKKDLRDVNRLIKAGGEYEMVHSTPEQYFKELRRYKDRLPRREKDINPFATGCYTSQVQIKQKHRQLENELYLTEKMAVAAWVHKRMAYPGEELSAAQRDLLWSEFHDILPGSSIKPVEDDALRALDHGLEILSRVKGRAFFALCGGQPKAQDGHIPIMVYNPHPYAVRQIVECEFQLADQGTLYEFTDVKVCQNGRELATQVEQEHSNIPLDWRKHVVFLADLQPGQMSRLDCRLIKMSRRPKLKLQVRGGKVAFKTKELNVIINAKTGLVDRYRVNGVDAVLKNAFEAVVLRDNADPWGMLHTKYDKAAGRFRLMTGHEAADYVGKTDGPLPAVRVIEDGAVRSVVEALFKYHDSFLAVRYSLPKAGTEIEIDATVIWNEKDRMLKLSVPTVAGEGALAAKAIGAKGVRYLGQTAYGTAGLENDGSEVVAQKWVAVVDPVCDFAMTCINAGSYGSSCRGGQMALTLLRSASYACHPINDIIHLKYDRNHPRIDQGEQRFRFWFNAGGAAERINAVDREALSKNETPFAMSFYPSGDGRPTKPLAILSDGKIQVTAIKKAENNNDVIVRLFEPTGRKQATTLSLPIIRKKVRLQFGGFEIKTLRVNLASRKIVETGLMER